MPKYLVFVPASAESEAGAHPPTEALDAMMKYNEKLADAGMLVDAAGLQPTSKGARIRYEGGKTTVFDGPFAEAKELVAGFWQLEAKSLDDVVEWMKKAPFDGGVEIQIRPVADIDEFEDVLTPEIRARQERIEKKMRQH